MSLKKLVFRSVVVGCLAMPVLAHAGFNLVGDAGFSVGGKKFAETSTGSTVTSGGLFYLDGGVAYTFPQYPIQLQATLGYKGDSATATDGDASFDRMKSDLLAFYRTGNMRIGGGLSTHFSPKYEEKSDSYGDSDISYNTANGVVLQGDYFLSDALSVGLRFEAINYEASKVCDDSGCYKITSDVISAMKNSGDPDAAKVAGYLEPNATSFGFHMTYMFGMSK